MIESRDRLLQVAWDILRLLPARRREALVVLILAKRLVETGALRDNQPVVH
jgi:hypothetical protein